MSQSRDAQGNGLSLQPFDQMSPFGFCWASVPQHISQMDECRGGWQAAVVGGLSPAKGLLQRTAITLQLFISTHTASPQCLGSSTSLFTDVRSKKKSVSSQIP